MPSAEELQYAPYLKLQRARDHINDLSARNDAFLAERPFKLIERHHRKAGKTTYRVKADKPIPPEFSLIIGDAIHNMRAALDLVMFGMAGEIAPDIYFPFPKNADRMEAAIKKGHVQAAGKKVVEAIRLLKPYPDGNFGLNVIHALDIQDKHRLLILAGQRAVFTIGSGNDAILKPLLGENAEAAASTHVVLNGPEDTTLLTFHRRYTTRDLADSEQEAKVQPAFVITFGEGEITAPQPVPVLNALVSCANEAHAAVDTVIKAFLDPENTQS